jgi:peptidoglycan/xylan/chitin deacetylase (PgdA/CDA1 family)
MLPTPTSTATLAPTATRTSTWTPTATPTAAATPTSFITAPAAGETVSIPILMYHHLKFRDANASEVLKTWTVSPDQFAAQLDFLKQRNYHTITFKQLVEFFQEDKPLPPNPILLTFDDGWLDHYTVAFPELKKRGMVGNFFAVTQYVDVGGELLINWDQVLEMDRAGMEFGGHTLTHADLTQVNLEQVQRELRGAKQAMEEKLGHPTYALSYPFGAFNPYVVAQTQGAGYRAALILCCGYELSADTLLTLPRIRVSYDDTIEEIAEKLP